MLLLRLQSFINIVQIMTKYNYIPLLQVDDNQDNDKLMKNFGKEIFGLSKMIIITPNVVVENFSTTSLWITVVI